MSYEDIKNSESYKNIKSRKLKKDRNFSGNLFVSPAYSIRSRDGADVFDMYFNDEVIREDVQGNTSFFTIESAKGTYLVMPDKIYLDGKPHKKIINSKGENYGSGSDEMTINDDVLFFDGKYLVLRNYGVYLLDDQIDYNSNRDYHYSRGLQPKYNVSKLPGASWDGSEVVFK